jgi:hypothetical protein
MTLTTAHLLEADPELAVAIPPKVREILDRALVGQAVVVPSGKWDPPLLDPGSLGFLVLDGMIMRRVRLGPAPCPELLGPGDTLRPSDDEVVPGLSGDDATWQAIHETEIAVLDRRITTLVGKCPELSAAIASRLVRRSRCLAYLMAARHFRRVDDRLLAVLWHVAGLWGKMTAHSVLIPFRLTHEMLAEITAARRPSVTVALRQLEDRGRLARAQKRAWLLLGVRPTWQVGEHRLRHWAGELVGL